MKAQFLKSAAFLLALSFVAPAFADDDPPVVAVSKKVVEALEAQTGLPIVILERTGDDVGRFWYRAMKKLCDKTGDNWCDDQVRTLQDTTNPVGWSRVLVYKNDAGQQKSVCTILPPRPNVDSGFVATAFSDKVYDYDKLPTANETEAWLLLMHAASCINTKADDREQARADAFATLALTLIEGDPRFVFGQKETPARAFAGYRSSKTARWGVNVGERLLLDLWKDESGEALQKKGCQPQVVKSKDLNTDFIKRDFDGDNCRNDYARTGRISDENLWAWMSGRASIDVGSPPKPYTPFKMFTSIEDAVRYMWRTAGDLSSQ